ncbi:hypothetical protein T265_10763 [Opisthorchis viverrini]|uniref:EF-hand domain-containing protein n=2 Tax=Opisthorchis viverrini TaxID=6198 RepID=A0A074ZC34_OPIVI|nr:hypothetical protein T265_10763 [Opisthorchis viverrini]KER20765.1 hypothetical protein T265_10763 [Opisthorchis viverrini]
MSGSTGGSKVSLGPKLMNQGGKAMDAFLEAFFALDADNREVISLKDLRTYSQENNIEEGFPETFLRVFDTDNTGQITLDQFCKTLGLIPKQAREFRRRRTLELIEALTPSDLEIVHDDIDQEIKVKILQMFLDDLREAGRATNVDAQLLDESAQKLRQYLEQRYGRTWHIVVSINQQLAWFSYCPGYMFHFCLGRFAVLIWKTPWV